MIPQKPISKKSIYFEDINFDEMVCISAKKDRQVFINYHQKQVYKTYVPNWEFADNTEIAIDKGFYDYNLVPNFLALIKSYDGKNRGYICSLLNNNQLLAYYRTPSLSLTTLKLLLEKKISIKHLFLRKKVLNANHLNGLLYNILSKSVKSELLFTVGISHIWIGISGYHLLDLESIRPYKWLFCQDKNDSQYLRKIVNKQNFNKNLKMLIQLHQMKYPHKPINTSSDILRFWKEYAEINKIDYLPQNIQGSCE